MLILLTLFQASCDNKLPTGPGTEDSKLNQTNILAKSATNGTLILEAEADTYVRTDLNVRRNDNYGCERLMFIGTGRGGGGIPFGGPDAMRGLIRFDLSGVPSTPITSAILELTFFISPNGLPSSIFNVDVHRIVNSGPLTPWIEGNGTEAFPRPPGCTSTDNAFGVAWMGGPDPFNPQGAVFGLNNQTQPNFSPTVTASASINRGTALPGQVFQWDITSLVQDWLDGTVPNHGILLRDVTTDGSFRAVGFGAREGKIFNLFPDVVDGPRLILTGPTVVDLDIKPQSCPNPLNTKSNGVLPVAILGSEDLDVQDVDPSSVKLAGVSPLRSNIEDVSTPVVDREDVCDCTTEGPDGVDDLTLKFDTQAIVAALGAVEDGEEVVLTLTGELLDGTPIEGKDCIIIKSKGKKAINQETKEPNNRP